MLKLSKGVVIVETRKLNNLASIINSHLDHLDPSWGLMIFHGVANTQYVYDHFPNAFFSGVGKMNKGAYNRLLGSPGFWKKIPFEKILIIQHDSRLLRKGIEPFLKWDYIGAPWRGNHPFGGNGGLSLRSKSAMLAVTETYPYNGKPEDNYFTQGCVRLKLKIAPRSVGAQFSCEMIPRFGTLGCHALHRYAKGKLFNRIMNQYKKS